MHPQGVVANELGRRALGDLELGSGRPEGAGCHYASGTHGSVTWSEETERIAGPKSSQRTYLRLGRAPTQTAAPREARGERCIKGQPWALRAPRLYGGLLASDGELRMR